VLIFGKSSPLVDKSSDEFKSVGMTTRYSTTFRKKMVNKAKNSGQQINVKFDILNRELLDYVKVHGCKLLHLSSHVFEEGKLCLEDGKSGMIEYLTIDNLTKCLLPDSPVHNHAHTGMESSHHHSHACGLNVQLVVLAIPVSKELAKALVNMGVKHVVSFGYESFLKHSVLIPKVQQMIYNFCVSFYSKLLMNMINLKQAFDQAVNECFESDYQDIIQKF
jgi:hypothetical protein